MINTLNNTSTTQYTIEYSQFYETNWRIEILLYKRERYIPIMLSLISREVTLVS